MRNTVRKALSMCLVLVIVLAMGTTALAVETVKLNGYPNNKVGEEGITAEFQVSISNVVRKDSNIHASLGEVYVCQAPAVVTSLDELSGFGVSTFVPMMDTYIEGEYLIPDGQTESWFEEEVSSIPAGTKFTLTTPGLYYVYGNYGALEGGVTQVILVEGSSTTPTTPTTPPATNAITATPTSSKVLVNGTAMEFDAYTINGNNYFKLRDVAKVVSGSEKQFEVTWNSEKKAIDMVSGQPYTVVGGEMAKGDGTSKSATLNTSTVYKDGAVVELTAYTINGNNYFKLRDLGQAFNFNVSWDGANNCIVVNTSEGYTAD
ncbi:copper amine oxidase N-terminal domain-containing protein [Butyricicoccus faecihominis]|uniref:copper amine oxidase N-terminal domain-containing protein n=1 Tax=Butyricicoccus faecihominis TaxID=1712515 RepID=UPI002478E798|nr:copper amine oxidase N-terminal domain-containing protein [Butyricicoccus faecihominis]MCQ5128802.1 copper amine oxidase N-terminal domain-containing protein [Butyricicoccus faecihominis]